MCVSLLTLTAGSCGRACYARLRSGGSSVVTCAVILLFLCIATVKAGRMAAGRGERQMGPGYESGSITCSRDNHMLL